MSLPLKDVRSKVPVEVWAFIKGMAKAQNKDESEVVRDVLCRWHGEISHAVRIAEAHMKVEGM